MRYFLSSQTVHRLHVAHLQVTVNCRLILIICQLICCRWSFKTFSRQFFRAEGTISPTVCCSINSLDLKDVFWEWFIRKTSGRSALFKGWNQQIFVIYFHSFRSKMTNSNSYLVARYFSTWFFKFLIFFSWLQSPASCQ